MFCTKCGKQVPDGSVICPFCGSPLAAPQAAPQVAPQAAKAANDFVGKAKKGDKKTLITIAIAVVAAIVLVILAISLFGNGPKKVVKSYVKQIEKLEEKLDDVTAKYELFSNKKARKKLDMDDEKDENEAKTSWKITKVKKYGGSDDTTEGMKAVVKGKKGDEDKVKKSAIVEITYTYKEKGEKAQKIKMYVAVVKVGGKWYVLSDPTTGYENINDYAEYFENKAGSSKKSKKDDD